jgi:predicted transcriptional regulator
MQTMVLELDEEVGESLRRRAVRHGRSLDAEVREILRDVARTEEPEDDIDKTGFGTWMARQFAGLGLKKGEIEDIRGDWGFRSPDFGE